MLLHSLALPACCQRDSTRPAAAGTPRLAVAGLGGGVAGFLVGALAGSRFDDHSNCSGEICDATGAFIGAGVGWLLGAPLGVHLANHGRGSLVRDYATASAAVLAVGMVAGTLAWKSDAAAAGGSLAIPLVHIGTAVWAERRWSR